jgi:hypothetical protein
LASHSDGPLNKECINNWITLVYRKTRH